MPRFYPPTAASNRTHRHASVYAIYYGNIPHYRLETMEKWFDKVLFLLNKSQSYTGVASSARIAQEIPQEVGGGLYPKDVHSFTKYLRRSKLNTGPDGTDQIEETEETIDTAIPSLPGMPDICQMPINGGLSIQSIQSDASQISQTIRGTPIEKPIPLGSENTGASSNVTSASERDQAAGAFVVDELETQERLSR